MSNKSTLLKYLKRPHFYIAGFGMGSCVVGSLSGLTGNIGLAVASVLVVGVSSLVFFMIKAKSLDKGAAVLIPESEALGGKTIPADRIDQLTGLANENGLLTWFAERGARLTSDGKGIVLLVADLADFDQFERTQGKKIADAVLIEVAKRIETCTGADGIASRISGGQFVAVATVVPKNSAEVAAEQAGKLADLMQRPVELSTGVIWIGGSVGVAYGAPSDGTGVLTRAREALKRAKKLGRGHYVVDNTHSGE